MTILLFDNQERRTQLSDIITRGFATETPVRTVQILLRRGSSNLWLVAGLSVLVLRGLAFSAEAPHTQELTGEQYAERERKAHELNEQAVKLSEQGRYLEATTLLENALSIRRTVYPVDKYPHGHSSLAANLNNLGSLFQYQGEYDKAERFYNDGLAMLQALYPKDQFPHGHVALATSLSNVGILLVAKGEYRKAERFLRDALAMRQALYPKNPYPNGHAELATSLNNLGMLFQFQGDYVKAENFYSDALDMDRALYPKDKYPHGHSHLATSMNNLGALLQFQGDYGRAERLYRDAHANLQALYPNGHPYLAGSLDNLASLLRTQGEYGKAEQCCRDALDMRKALYPKDKYPQGHPQLATSLSNLGNLLYSKQQYGEAERFLRDALAMRRALYPKEKSPHPELTLSLNNLGVLLCAEGDYNKAEPFLREALDMRNTLYPKDKYPQGHPQLADSLNNLASLFAGQGEYAKAEALCWQALEMYENLASLFADATSEIQGLNYLAQFPLTRDAFLSLPHHMLKTPPDRVYTPIWRSKASVTRLLERRQQTLLAASDATTRQLTDKLFDTRRQLARLLLASGGDAKMREQKLKELGDLREDVERQLARLLPSSVFASDQELLSSHTELAKQLQDRTVFVDVLRYVRIQQDPDIPGNKGKTHTLSYVAFVLGKGDPVQRVELGPAKLIEDALADWRQAINDWEPKLDVDSRQRINGKAALAAGILRRSVWDPLAKQLPPNIQTVYLAPDGALSRLPWAALPGTKEGTVLLEELAVVLVPHGPFLLRSLTRPASQSDPNADLVLTIGDVPYDREAEPLDTATSDLPTQRSAAMGPNGLRWPNLPGTKAEVERITQQAGRRPRLDLRGPKASTARVQSELPQARWAHFATHGFFADPSFRSVLRLDEKLFQYRGTMDRNTPGARNPLVLSGLVLAGANLPPGLGQDLLTYDHGIMVADTLSGLDLRKLELAVLSACDTGLGDVAGGEGVFGLQRAFHLAGTRNVIASLWKINDEATAALMALFYHKLWQENKTPLQALREAQLTLYHHPERIPLLARERGFDFNKVVKLPAEPTAAPHDSAPQGRIPVKLWAGFVLSGPGR